jgi:hypothetical protein
MYLRPVGIKIFGPTRDRYLCIANSAHFRRRAQLDGAKVGSADRRLCRAMKSGAWC